MSEMLDNDLGIVAQDHAVRMAVELHHLPAGPLNMYTRLDLTGKPYLERKGITQQDLEPDYSVLYFPENNQSRNEYYETISVVRHNPEDADNTKRMLSKVTKLRLGQWVIEQHEEEKRNYLIDGVSPFLSNQDPYKTSKQLNLPYAAIIFSSISTLSKPRTVAQLHIPIFADSKRTLKSFRTAIDEQPAIQNYEVKADSVARVIC